jgi:hypothetical protein
MSDIGQLHERNLDEFWRRASGRDVNNIVARYSLVEKLHSEVRCGSNSAKLGASITSPVIPHLPTFEQTSLFVVQGQIQALARADA